MISPLAFVDLFVAFQYLQEKIKPMEWADVDNSDAEPEIEQYTK